MSTTPPSKKTLSPQARRALAAHRIDTMIRVIVACAVAVIALVAATISFDHMYLLASAHHQPGWRAVAFPVSVDGLELVSSLVLLAEHREHGKTSLLAWIALGTGTGASLAANVAVGAPHDLIGRFISGWPAITLLVTLKLAAGRLSVPARPAGPTRAARPVLDLDGSGWPADGPDRSHSGPHGSGGGPLGSGEADQRTESRTRLATDHSRTELGELVTHARRVRDAMRAEGRRLTRRELAERLRSEGRAVSNDRAGALVRALAAEVTHSRTVAGSLVSLSKPMETPDERSSEQRDAPAETT